MPSLEEDTESELQALIGSTVANKYRVERLIGRGGMGAVFQASNLAIGKRVALKFLDHEAARDREACQRFQLEAEAASMVDSAHIVQIFDSGVSDAGLPYLVMELLTGEDLRTRLRREGPLSAPSALRIASQVLRALVRAHQAGIIHRDLKPDNVFLCARDDDASFVKLVDFGISKVAHARDADTLTRRGTVLGTAFYMSPEQAQSFADIDGRTDLFSVGAMLFEMLSGSTPHTGPTYEAVLIAICTQDSPNVQNLAPHVPDGLAALVRRALARERDLRFQSAEEFLSALQALGVGGNAAVSSTARRGGGTLAAGLMATLLGFALTAYLLTRKTTPPTVFPEGSPRTSAAVPAGSANVIETQVGSDAPKPFQAPPTALLPVANKARPKPLPQPSTHVASGLQLSTKEP